MGGVKLENVRKVYPNGRAAVAGASFEVQPGELIVFVGPSGCGKTTLLRMIAGLEEISAGTLSIAGRVVNDLAPKDRDIAMVFQNYALYPHMSVAENMGFGLKLRGLARSAIEAKVKHAATMLGLEHVLDMKPGQLSGGQQQRVAVGRALVREPKVFLFDEPLSNLDAKMRLSMRVEIARLHRRLGTTMIYVTHDQIEAMTLGQRIVVLRDGVIQQIDTPMRLYREPVNLFVAGFLGSPAMNTLRGTYRAAAAGSLELSADTRIALALPPATQARLAAYDGRELVLGLRPEQLRRADAATPRDWPRCTAQVDVVEPVGSEVFVEMRWGACALTARLAPDCLPAVGDSLELGFDPAELHFFDAASEQRIALQ